MISVLAWYRFILRASESRLKHMIAFYNYGLLPKKLRLALEIIDGLSIED